MDMKKIRKVMTRRNGFILVFLLPGILLFGIIYAYPLVNIFMTSFCKWNYKNFHKPEFLGWGHLFDNYIKLFTVDGNFQRALVNSLKWVALTMVVQVPFTLLVALVLSKKPQGLEVYEECVCHSEYHFHGGHRADIFESLQSLQGNRDGNLQ